MSEDDALPESEQAAFGIYGPDGRPKFFSDPATDRFVASLLNLASEVWAQEERILALEARGSEALPPLTRDEILKQFIARVFAPLREDHG